MGLILALGYIEDEVWAPGGSNYPRSVFIMAKPTNIGSVQGLVWYGNNGRADQYYCCAMDVTGALRVDHRQGSTAFGTTGNVCTEGAYNGFYCEWTATNARRGVLNADFANETVSTDSRSTLTIVNHAIGRFNDSTPTNPFQGTLAKFMQFNDTLTNAQISALNVGLDPSSFVTNGLPALPTFEGYEPLSEGIDEGGSNSIDFHNEVNATYDSDDHPPTIYRLPERIRAQVHYRRLSSVA